MAKTPAPVELTEEQKAAKKAEAQAAKAAKFVELANARVGKALSAIDIIGNLASPNYVYTQEQADKIVAALTSEVETLKTKFAKPEAAAKTGFSL